MRRHLKESGIEVENSKGEWGLGQHEINMRYGRVMEMADRSRALQAVPERGGRAVRRERDVHGEAGSGQAGSGCHIHFSLWKDGRTHLPGTSGSAR